MECRNEGQHITRFLRDILIPSSGPSSIPDDKVRRHVLRQETITFNIMAGESGKGAFILFPNNPGSIIGAHLKYDADAGKYVYDQAITVAQDLRKSYSLARQTGCILTIKSSTLPSGVYALSGTFNAATYEGPPSELSDGRTIIPDYGKVLQITANSHDKIGNVKVGEGLTVLALPVSWDNPYTRLSDEIASSAGMGGVYALDDTASLNYYGGPGSVTKSAPYTGVTAQTLELARSNFDSNQACTARYRFRCRFTIDQSQANDAAIIANFKANLHAIDGSVVKTTSVTKNYTIMGGGTDSGYLDVDVDTSYPGFGDLENPRIIGVTSLSVEFGATIAPSKATNFNVVVTNLEFNGKSVNGNFPGTNNPTTVVVYEGVPKGATLTGSGFKNYELIPNQELLKNITTIYPKMDPQGLAYAKAVFAHREQLQLRSVWATPEYENRMQLFNEIASRGDPGESSVAMAWGLGDVIRTIRRFVPTLAGWADQVIPGAGGILRGANSVANHFFGEAASGQLFAPAASGKLYAASGRLLDTSSVIPMSDALLMRKSYAADNKLRLFGNTGELFDDGELLLQNGLTRKGHYQLGINTTPGSPSACVFFPAIVVEGSSVTSGSVVGTQIYAVVRGDYSPWLPQKGVVSGDRYKIFGIKNFGETSKPPIGTFTVLPVRSIAGNIITIDPTAPVPEGSSMQLALMLMTIGGLRGLVPYAFTGAVSDTGEVEPNKWAHLKKEGMVGYNIPLIANNSAADLRVNTVEEAIKLANSTTMGPSRVHNFKTPKGKNAYAANEPAWVDKLYDLFDEVIPLNSRFARLRDVTVWLALNDQEDGTTLDGLWDYSRADPRAGALRKVVVNSLVNAKVKGPTQEDNINSKIIEIVNKTRKTGFPATADWVRANGNRGPSSAQIMMFKENGVLPEPEMNPSRIRVVSADVAEAIAVKVFNNSFDKAKKLPQQNREPLLNELMEIARNTGKVTDEDTSRLRMKYFTMGTPNTSTPTPRPRRVNLQPVAPMPARVNSVSSLESVDLAPPPVRPRASRSGLRFIADDGELV